jgi:hypothetical protein
MAKQRKIKKHTKLVKFLSRTLLKKKKKFYKNGFNLRQFFLKRSRKYIITKNLLRINNLNINNVFL